MRESIAGGWLFGIVIVFLFLFAFFLAYSINYTKSFNVKNEVITLIEHNEGFRESATDNEGIQAKISHYIIATGYDYQSNLNNPCVGGKNFTGVCIVKVCPEGTNHRSNHTYYQVTSYINMKVPFLGIGFSLPVTGETRVIVEDNGGWKCNDE